ncbi:hypothetical protein AAZX31_14G117600 [Glycine max]
MASASNNPPPLPLPVNNAVLMNHATLVNTISMNADAAMPVAATFSTIAAKDFSHSVSKKLTNSYYLLWCQQVEPVIKGHRLHYLITNPQIPLRYASLADHDAENISSEFLLWEQHDQLLLPWL